MKKCQRISCKQEIKQNTVQVVFAEKTFDYNHEKVIAYRNRINYLLNKLFKFTGHRYNAEQPDAWCPDLLASSCSRVSTTARFSATMRSASSCFLLSMTAIDNSFVFMCIICFSLTGLPDFIEYGFHMNLPLMRKKYF